MRIVIFNQLNMIIKTVTMPQQRKKEESERLRGERDQIKFIDLGFERWQVQTQESKKKASHSISCTF